MARNIDLEDKLILGFIKLLRALVRVLPTSAALALGRFAGFIGYSVSKRRDIAYKNLKAAFAGEKTSKELRRIARGSVETLGMNMIELLRIPDMDQAYIREHIQIEGEEVFKKIYAEGKGVIFLTAHFGNWELLNITSAILNYPLLVLARVQRHPRSDEYLNSLRASKGSRVVYKGILVREILKALKKGEIVGILSDQDGGKNGAFVNFFNRRSSSPTGAATFAFRTGAAIIPVFATRLENGRHRIEVKKALQTPSADLPDEEKERFVLQQFADVLEKQIRQSPDQWLWGHRRWKSTPDRSLVILSDGKAGHLNQSLAVLQAIRAERKAMGAPEDSVREKIIDIYYKNKAVESWARFITWLFSGHLPFKRLLLKMWLSKASYEAVMRAYADIVISCGSSLVPTCILVAHENNAKSVVVMKPFCGTGVFDAVIVPRHDKIKKGRNIYVTDKALSLINRDYLNEEGKKLRQSLNLSLQKGPVIGLLMGGDTEKTQFSPIKCEKALNEVSRFLEQKNGTLLATTSRRTPGWLEAELKSRFSKNPNCPLLVIANEVNRSGVVPGILDVADTVLVSGESMSMLSEAASSGKPVLVFKPTEKMEAKKKYETFLNLMQESGLLRVAEVDQIYNELSAKNLENKRIQESLAKDEAILKLAVRTVL